MPAKGVKEEESSGSRCGKEFIQLMGSAGASADVPTEPNVLT